MAMCKWSQDNLCQVMVLKNTDTKVTCDGRHAACLPSRKLNLEDIRNRKPPQKRGWGGRRVGAGAPRGNLNRLVHGRDSKLIRHAVEKLAQDPELRAFLLLIARAATTGEIAETTRQNIIRVLGDSPLRRQVATISLKQMREGVSHES